MYFAVLVFIYKHLCCCSVFTVIPNLRIWKLKICYIHNINSETQLFCLCGKINMFNGYQHLQTKCYALHCVYQLTYQFPLLCISVHIDIFFREPQPKSKSFATHGTITSTYWLSVERQQILSQKHHFKYHKNSSVNLQAPCVLYIRTGISLLSRECFLYI